MTVDPQYHDDFGDVEFDVEPWVGWNWKSTRTRDQWQPLLDRMKQLRGEAEWRSVLDDDTNRQIALINLSHTNMEEWASRLGRHGLHYRTLRYSKPYEGFAHSHRSTDPSNPRRLCFAAIAPNDDLLDKAEEARELGGHEKHERLGELLGFPECCREFFHDVWLDENINDPMYEIACNSPSAERRTSNDEEDCIRVHDPDPFVNPLWRYFRLSFVTHLPCSFDCTESKKVAYNRAEIMEDVDEDAAHALKSWLDQPHTWSGHNGIAHIRSEPAVAQSQTSAYLQDKRIEWKGDHPPGGKVPGGDGTEYSGVTAPQ